MSGFSKDYYEHYCCFEGDEKTPYLDKKYRCMGNCGTPKAMYTIYKKLFGKTPSVYVDLGCGTGEELDFYLNKNCEVLGCDFSDFVLKNKNKNVAKFIHKTDSLTFMKNLKSSPDIIWENTLQYLDTMDFNKLMEYIRDKSSKDCILGVLFDETIRIHPYRKQCHPIYWWVNTMRKYGFIKSTKLMSIMKPKTYNRCRQYIFVKKSR